MMDNQELNPPIAQTFSKPRLVYVLVVGLVLVFGGIGGYLLGTKKTSAPAPTLAPKTTTNYPAATTSNEMAGWKTYSKYWDVSFEYPSEYEIKLSGGGGGSPGLIELQINSAPYVGIEYIDNQKGLTFQQIDEENAKKVRELNYPMNFPRVAPLNYTEAETKNGYTYYYEKEYFCEPSLCERYTLKHNNKIIQIIIYPIIDSTLNKSQVINRILSSFKFLPSASAKLIDPTANWKSVQLNKLGLKIPESWWSSSLQIENDKTGYSWVNINPSPLPYPGDAVPGFAVYFEQNKTPTLVKDEFIKKWGLTDVAESIQKQSLGEVLLLEGNTQPGFLESKRFQLGIIAHGNDSYYLIDLTLIDNHKMFFDQILSTFRFE